jgi:hypothetical protein
MLHLARKAFYPAPALPAAACRYHLEVPGNVQAARPHGAESGMELLVYHNPRSNEKGHQPVRSRPAPHRYVEDRRAEAGARQVASTRPLAARAATRKRAAPRSASSRSAPPAMAGTRRTSAPNCGTSTTPQEQGREHPRLPDLELDRARHLAIYPPQRHPDRAALLRANARPWSATACC